MEDYGELWVETPMYQIRNFKDFLPLFQDKPMKRNMGERFHDNNAGYILLGLIVEQASQLNFVKYVEEHIFRKEGMEESGYFEFDALPSRTALGYIDYPNGTWKTNIYSLPAKGGSDGGAFVTVNDMIKLWDALMNHLLLSETYTQQLLTRHIRTNVRRTINVIDRKGLKKMITISCTKKLFELSSFVEEQDTETDDEFFKWHANVFRNG